MISYESYRFALEGMGAIPIIILDSRGRVEAISSSSLYFSRDDSYTCFACQVVYHFH
ncbi:MAG: hypothetical protein KAW83_02760 [Dehalococcoidia bacterium]|nr:hypothetical protein [Dehalococcoidia bacterium]